MTNRSEEVLVQSIVLLDRQYLLTKNIIEKQSNSLLELANNSKNQSQGINNVLDIYNYVFGLIDNLVRYQKIANSIPKMSQKAPEFRAFNKAMGRLKDIRNQHQHINNEIDESRKNSGPLLGSISWISGQTQHTVAFPDIGRTKSMPGLIFDTYTGEFTTQFSYIYNEEYYDLGKSIEALGLVDKPNPNSNCC